MSRHPKKRVAAKPPLGKVVIRNGKFVRLLLGGKVEPIVATPRIIAHLAQLRAGERSHERE